jgi:hypothetical protein
MYHTTKKRRIAKGIFFGIIFISVISVLVFLLWNWLMPSIFGLPAINMFQAFGLLLLSKILFFGFHKRVGPSNHFRSREYWKKRFEEEHKLKDEDLGGEKV